MPRRFEAVAVDTASRSQGIASALLGGCVALYDQVGYLLIYGAFQPSWGLAAFYQALDFDVPPAGYGIDVKVIVAGRACWALRAGSSYLCAGSTSMRRPAQHGGAGSPADGPEACTQAVDGEVYLVSQAAGAAAETGGLSRLGHDRLELQLPCCPAQISTRGHAAPGCSAYRMPPR
jgi:hypothetical protein